MDTNEAIIPQLDHHLMHTIDAIDFSAVIHKMIFNYGFSQKQALALCQQYKRFLYLCKQFGGQHTLVPSDEIDEFWHNHILDTKKYWHDCDLIFGKYIHHNPEAPWETPGKNNLDYAEQFAQTQELYRQTFGDYIYMIKPLSPKRFIKNCLFKLRLLRYHTLSLCKKYWLAHTSQVTHH